MSISACRVVVACSLLHQKAKQKYVLVVMDRICHSAASRLMLLSCTLCSFTIMVQTQGTFVNHKGGTDKLNSPGSEASD